MFSSRVPGELQMNRLAGAVAAHRRAGRTMLDLTTTNPTTVGIPYPPDILHGLSSAAARSYAPEPFGLRSAREAVSRDYRRRGIAVAPERIVLTASTSEAYSLLLKLLCEPHGDEVLVPAPSYPLFDHLTRLDGVASRTYALAYHGRWEVDADSLEAAWTVHTRAVLAVSPNNPTGSVLRSEELAALASRCAERGAALVVDEVFCDYRLASDAAASGTDERTGDSPSQASRDAGALDRASEGDAWTRQALTFRLGGLSKSAGLPQVKLGWIAIDGPEPAVADAMTRLELICDTYLSVSTPVQVAAPDLIERGVEPRTAIRDRVRTNHRLLSEAAGACPCIELLAAEAGWAAVLRVPARQTEEEMVLALLEERGTLVHPGYFFDFPHEAFFVVSLLPDPAVFRDGVHRVMEYVDA